MDKDTERWLKDFKVNLNGLRDHLDAAELKVESLEEFLSDGEGTEERTDVCPKCSGPLRVKMHCIRTFDGEDPGERTTEVSVENMEQIFCSKCDWTDCADSDPLIEEHLSALRNQGNIKLRGVMKDIRRVR